MKKYQVLSEDYKKLLKDYNSLLINHKKLHTKYIIKKKELYNSNKIISTKVQKLQNKVNGLQEEIEWNIRDYNVLH